MSVSRSGGGNRDMSYAELSWTGIRYLLTNDGGNNSSVTDQRDLNTETAPPNGLDGDEIAELVYASIVPFAQIVRDPAEPDQEPGMATCRLSLGFNHSGLEDAVHSADTDVENIPIDGRGTVNAGAASIGDPTDDPGLLDQRYVAVAWPGNDTVNGSGGGSGPAFWAETLTYNYRDLYGRGPIVDGADDLTVAATVDKRVLDNIAEAGYVVQMGWDVAEVEERRATFALP